MPLKVGHETKDELHAGSNADRRMHAELRRIFEPYLADRRLGIGPRDGDPGSALPLQGAVLELFATGDVENDPDHFHTATVCRQGVTGDYPPARTGAECRRAWLPAGPLVDGGGAPSLLVCGGQLQNYMGSPRGRSRLSNSSSGAIWPGSSETTPVLGS